MKLDDIDILAFIDKLTPGQVDKALCEARHETLQEAVRQLLGMVARTGIEMIQADCRANAADAALGRVAELPAKWRELARSVHQPNSPSIAVECAEELEEALTGDP